MEESPQSDETEWLTSDELQTWRALHGVISALPDVLGGQLRREVNLSFLEYYVLACLSEQPDLTLRMSQLGGGRELRAYRVCRISCTALKAAALSVARRPSGWALHPRPPHRYRTRARHRGRAHSCRARAVLNLRRP